MTPEELEQVEKKLGIEISRRVDVGRMLAPTTDVMKLAIEVRRLWAERDARLLVGRPLSEAELELARRSCDEPWFQYAKFSSKLVGHIAFLERLLADADDLPQVRRTGYADGWRAAMEWATLAAQSIADDPPIEMTSKSATMALGLFANLLARRLREHQS